MELFHRLMTLRREQDDMVSGITPVMEFRLRLRYLRRVKQPMSGGMWPLIWLSSMWILLRKLRSAMQGNIWPVMFSYSRSRATARAACRMPHVTPRQSQNANDSFLHESSAPAGSERRDRRQRRACRSLSDMLWIVDVANEHTQGHGLTRRRMNIKTSCGNSEFWAATACILLPGKYMVVLVDV